MSKVHSSKKKHVKQVVSFLLSFIIIFTAHPLSFAYGAEEKAVDIIHNTRVSEDDIVDISSDSAASGNEPSGTEETGTVSDNEPSGTEETIPVSDNETVDISSNSAASADTVTGETAENIPFGAFDDEIEIENPEPLEEFKTPVSEGEDMERAGSASIMSYGIQSLTSEIPGYAISYNGVAEGLLPDSLRHQGNSSLCWAFSSALLAEVSMIKNRLAPRSVHYSEDQIGYFFYHHQTDPLGGTVSDETIIVPSYATYYNRGGNNFFTNWSMAAWTSVRNQTELPFRNSAYTVSEVSPNLAYNSVAHMQNSYWFDMASTGDDISYVENVKELVYRFGAASVIIYDHTAINTNHAAYNTTASGGHNVSIIGWDDDFDASLFSTRPAGNGAWYIRDNYDTDGNRDENGCYWMSYYDKSLRRTNNKAIAFDFESGDNYDNNYQYDGGTGGSILSWTGTRAMAANVFTAKNDEVLEAVGFAPAVAESGYNISVYKLVSACDAPDSGTKVSTVTGSTRYVGYRTVPLSEKVSLSAGQVYSVVVDITGKEENARLFVDADYDANSDPAKNWLSVRPSTSANQSYVRSGSSWADMHGYNGRYRTFRIKAYTNNADDMRASYELLDTDDYTYDGSTEHRVKVTVSGSGGEPMTEGTDYSVEYRNNVKAGTAGVSVNPLNGESIGNRYFSFSIAPRSISEDFIASVADDVYTGSACTPEVSMTDDLLGPMKNGTDYRITYRDNIDAGTGYASFHGIGNYTGAIDVSFNIAPKSAACFETDEIKTAWYTGRELTPKPVVTDSDLDVILTEDVDYTLSYKNNINEGLAEVSVNGIGNYTGSVSTGFVIKKKTISIDGIQDMVYTGEALTPSLVVKDMDEGRVLSEGSDYTVSYQDNKNAGTAKVFVSILRDYPDAPLERNFKILPKTTDCFDVAKIEPVQYTGEPLTPAPLVTDRDLDRTLSANTDYTVSYNNNINEGTALVYITGKGNYRGTVSAGFFISAAPQRDIAVKKIKNVTFRPGADQTIPAVKVVDGKRTLTEDRDYRLVFSGNEHAGTATVSVQGIERTVYDTSSARAEFTILPYSLKKAKIEGIADRLYKEDTDYSEEGLEVTVYVPSYVTGQPVMLKEGTDYELAFDENTKMPKKAGAKVSYYIKGIGDYSGSVRKSFVVRDYIPMSDPECFDIAIEGDEYVYDGSAIKPGVSVVWKKDGDPSDTELLTEGIDYTLSYSNNKNAGRARVKIVPTASFKRANRVKGSAYLYFTIRPKTIEGCNVIHTTAMTYNGKARKPSVKVYTPDGKRLSSGQYYIEYEDNIFAGTATIRVIGKKNHAGVLYENTFEIMQQSFKKVKLQYKYDKNAGSFRYFRVKYGTSILRENIDYTLSEEGPGDDGRYTVTVTPLEGRSFLTDATKSMKYRK